MIEAKEIQRYKNKSIPALLKIAERHFNKFIRERDRDGDYFFCPTCGNTKRIIGDNYQACHLNPAGHHPELRYNEDNVHGGCKSCNYYKHGAGYNFSPYVRNKIGEERFNKLEEIKAYYKRNVFKWDRYSLIEIILKYKQLNKKHDKVQT
jgi:hypothetical protein